MAQQLSFLEPKGIQAELDLLPRWEKPQPTRPVASDRKCAIITCANDQDWKHALCRQHRHTYWNVYLRECINKGEKALYPTQWAEMRNAQIRRAMEAKEDR